MAWWFTGREHLIHSPGIVRCIGLCWSLSNWGNWMAEVKGFCRNFDVFLLKQVDPALHLAGLLSKLMLWTRQNCGASHFPLSTHFYRDTWEIERILASHSGWFIPWFWISVFSFQASVSLSPGKPLRPFSEWK